MASRVISDCIAKITHPGGELMLVAMFLFLLSLGCYVGAVVLYGYVCSLQHGTVIHEILVALLVCNGTIFLVSSFIMDKLNDICNAIKVQRK